MFLSHVPIDPLSPFCRRDMTNVHDMHRTLMSALPEAPEGTPARAHHALLWRLEGRSAGPVLYVQSAQHPDWNALPAGYLSGRAQVKSLKPVLSAVEPGAEFTFRLVANPTKVTPPTGRAGHRGKRYPLKRPEEQLAWLGRQGARSGFTITETVWGDPDVTVSPRPPLLGRKQPPEGDGRTKQIRITVSAVTFDGHLRITDPEAFTSAFVQGVGRGKAYGCGLLSLAPARR